jgi:hypothetical protein
MIKWIWRCGATTLIALGIMSSKAYAGEEAVAGFAVPLEKLDASCIQALLCSYSDEDINVLQRIVEAECTGQDLESKKNIASAIINRVFSDEFPNNIPDVVFQRSSGYYQFSPIADGRYYDVEITDSTADAVTYVLQSGPVHSGVYFCNMRYVKSKSTRDWFSSLKFLFEDSSGTSYYK